MFKFKNYTKSELITCGQLFERDLVSAASRIGDDETAAWTEFVLDWFAETAEDEILVDARYAQTQPGTRGRRATAGEFLVDLTHSTYPKYSADRRYSSGAYFDEALKTPCCVRLALESEWGKRGAPEATRVAVLQDAIKVAAMRADVKVVVFGPEDQARGEKLFDDLKTLRSRSKDEAPWLCVALPWANEGPTARVFS